MRAGHWPRFIFRTPGYPLLIWLVTSSPTAGSPIVSCRTCCRSAPALCLVYAGTALRRALALPAAIAMCGFLGSSQVLFYDISLMSDSLYTSMVILAWPRSYWPSPPHRAAAFSLVSALMALVDPRAPRRGLPRGDLCLILAYLLWNRSARACDPRFRGPVPGDPPALLRLQPCDDRAVHISPFAEANLAGATALFWEPDPRLPPRSTRPLRAFRPPTAKQGDHRRRPRAGARRPGTRGRCSTCMRRRTTGWCGERGWGSGTRFGSGDYLHNRSYIRDVSSWRSAGTRSCTPSTCG
jgi:hypothetical protein